MSNPLNVTRNQLAEFLPNQRAIRAFEQLLQQVNSLLPDDIASINKLIEESLISASFAESKSQSALDQLNKIVDLLELMAFSCNPALGTIASLNKDFIDFIGFNQGAGKSVLSGQLAWNSADGCLDIGMGYDGVVLQTGLETLYRIKASAAITNGQLVMFDGSVGASGVLKGKPSTGITNGQEIMGVATMDIANNGFGYVTAFGLVRGINTTGSSVGETWADGDILYYNSSYAGGLTKVQPVAPGIKVIAAAVVNAGSGGSGSLFVRPTFLPNVGDLSDVSISSPAANQLIRRNSANTRWENYSGASGTFKSGDIPQKTITVVNGVITSIA
jgi:hypothetical protein